MIDAAPVFRVVLWNYLDCGENRVTEYATLEKAMAFVEPLEEGMFSVVNAGELHYQKGTCLLATIRSYIKEVPKQKGK